MYQGEVKPNLHYLDAPPPQPPPDSESAPSGLLMTAVTTTTASADQVPTSSLHFALPSFTDPFQQLHSIPETWITPTPSLPSTQHVHNSYESITPPSYTRLRRSQALAFGCKHGATVFGSSVKRGFRSLREERDENCRRTNGTTGSPGAGVAAAATLDGAAAMATVTKQCRVCGDRAVNHNFGQLTCESCKAFFRRNAHKVGEHHRFGNVNSIFTIIFESHLLIF